jgi:hypothetical protein
LATNNFLFIPNRFVKLAPLEPTGLLKRIYTFTVCIIDTLPLSKS